MSDYQKQKIAERLEILAISSFRDGDDYGYVDTIIRNANKAYNYGFSYEEITNIVVKAYDYINK